MTLWTPANYGAGVVGSWHDPSDSATVTLASGKVSQITDKGANGYTEAQASAGSQPTYVASLLNGLNGEDFGSGGGPYYTSSRPGNPSVLSFVGVIQWHGVGPASIFGASTAGGLQLRISGGDMQLLRQQVALIGSSTGAAIGADVWAIVTASYRPSTGAYSFRVNGTARGSGTSVQTPAASTTLVGAQTTGGGEVFNRYMAERLALASDTLSDVQLAEGYLAWKWGLQASLPGGHPYASAAPTTGGGGTAYTTTITASSVPIGGSAVAAAITRNYATTITPSSVPIIGASVSPSSAGNYSVTVSPSSVPVVGSAVSPFSSIASAVTIAPGDVPIAGQSISPVQAVQGAITISAGTLPIVGESLTAGYGSAVAVAASAVPVTGLSLSDVLGRSLGVSAGALPITGANLTPVAASVGNYSISISPSAVPISGLGLSVRSALTVAFNASAVPIQGASFSEVWGQSEAISPAAVPVVGSDLSPVLVAGQHYTLSLAPGSVPILGLSLDLTTTALVVVPRRATAGTISCRPAHRRPASLSTSRRC